MQDDDPFARDPRLGRIAALLGMDDAAFRSGESNGHDRLAEMLQLWPQFTRQDDQKAVLAYARRLADEAAAERG